jgi:hypothetical protein
LPWPFNGRAGLPRIKRPCGRVGRKIPPHVTITWDTSRRNAERLPTGFHDYTQVLQTAALPSTSHAARPSAGDAYFFRPLDGWVSPPTGLVHAAPPRAAAAFCDTRRLNGGGRNEPTPARSPPPSAPKIRMVHPARDMSMALYGIGLSTWTNFFQPCQRIGALRVDADDRQTTMTPATNAPIMNAACITPLAARPVARIRYMPNRRSCAHHVLNSRSPPRAANNWLACELRPPRSTRIHWVIQPFHEPPSPGANAEVGGRQKEWCPSLCSMKRLGRSRNSHNYQRIVPIRGVRYKGSAVAAPRSTIRTRATLPGIRQRRVYYGLSHHLQRCRCAASA